MNLEHYFNNLISAIDMANIKLKKEILINTENSKLKKIDI